MALPPVGVLVKSVTCMPVGLAKYLEIPNKVISSGYAVDAHGNVPGDPAIMAGAAARAIARDTTLAPEVRARGGAVTLSVYTLARYVTSEVGTSNIADAIAVLQDAVNRVRYVERTDDVNRLLLTRQPLGHANRGWYGPINVVRPDGTTAPYGRWAATSKDPTIRAIALAQDVLADRIDPAFNKGADDQANITIYRDPPAAIRRLASEGKFWVGELPGASRRRSMHFRTLKRLDAATAKLLTDRALRALHEPAVDWVALRLPPCGAGGGGGSAITAIPGGGATALVVGTAAAAAAGAIGYALHRRVSR